MKITNKNNNRNFVITKDAKNIILLENGKRVTRKTEIDENSSIPFSVNCYNGETSANGLKIINFSAKEIEVELDKNDSDTINYICNLSLIGKNANFVLEFSEKETEIERAYKN